MRNTAELIDRAIESGNENAEHRIPSNLIADRANREVDVQDHVISQLTNSNAMLMRKLAIAQMAEEEQLAINDSYVKNENEVAELKSKIELLTAKLVKAEQAAEGYEKLIFDQGSSIKIEDLALGSILTMNPKSANMKKLVETLEDKILNLSYRQVKLFAENQQILST